MITEIFRTFAHTIVNQDGRTNVSKNDSSGNRFRSFHVGEHVYANTNVYFGRKHRIKF
jgi:hypothetical protein